MQESRDLRLESSLEGVSQTTDSEVPEIVDLERGELFNEHYEILEELGKGTYGVVRKVKKIDSGELLAAKFIKCVKPNVEEKAKEEIDIMNCLKHPKLLKLVAAFVNPKEVIMVTEYVSGGELYERVVAKDFSLTERDCVLFVRQICEGVDYIHKHNIVHLDLKPENIMCLSKTSHAIKIIDFGLAQKMQSEKPIRVLCGTAEFIPPEIVSFEPIGPPSDMWSVGVISYVLLSGKSPFRGANKSETYTRISMAEYDFGHKAFEAVSDDSKDFIKSLLIKTKEDRLTAEECLEHKWLTRQCKAVAGGVILSTDDLKKFVVRRKWHVTGNVIRALGRMNTLLAAHRRRGDCAAKRAGLSNGSIFEKFKMASLSEEKLC